MTSSRMAWFATWVGAFCLVSLSAYAGAEPGTGQPVPGNRISEFCRAAPAPTVVRAKLHGGADLAHVVEVECMWGEQSSTEHLAQRFFGNAEDETLLVAVGKDGNVLGTAWPVFKEKVSLEFGIPDMSEEEAVALLTSPKCSDDLRALRDKGVRPPKPTNLSSHSPPGRGCASCTVGSTTSISEVIFALALGAITLAVVRRRAAR